MAAIVVSIAGVALVLIILGDAFETIILPRRVIRRIRLTRIFYRYAWTAWAGLSYRIATGQRRETYLSFFGPLSLILLLSIWAAGLILGFALIFWATGSDEQANRLTGIARFASDLYISGGNFFGLGLESVLQPRRPLVKALTILECGMGFGFLAMIISYLPALNQAFSRREMGISLMDEHAGSPPTAFAVLQRHGRHLSILQQILFEWERWAAELMETQLSYPMLAHFRSQHDNQSWLGSLTVVLDTSALMIAGLEGTCKLQAEMTFAMARHAIVDLSIVFGKAPTPAPPDRMPAEILKLLLDRLKQGGLDFPESPEAGQRLLELRSLYEPYLDSLAEFHCLMIPPWILETEYPDNWRKSAWETSSRARRGSGLPGTDEHF